VEKPATTPTPAERRATRVVVALFLAVSAVFIVESTWELAKGAFQLDLQPVDGSSAEAKACFGEVRRLEGRIDQALVDASKVAPAEAPRAYAGALGDGFDPPAMAALEATCAKVPRGLVALSSVLRLHRAEEATLAGRATELAPIRADLARALPPP
jgi:hypothetical protein